MNLTMEEKQALEEMYLEHSGVLGMHWGQRRYQNPDGSLTTLGRIHYGIGQRRAARAEAKKTKVMQSGDAKTVLKYRKKLTDEEFDAAMARVAKTDALKANAYAKKNAKKAAKEAKKQQAQYTKEQRKNAEQIANQNAKQKTDSGDFWDKIAKAAVISGNLLSLYKNVSGIAKGLGLVEDKTNKNQKPQNSGTPVPTPTPAPKPEPPKPTPAPKPESPKPTPEPKKEYVPTITPVKEIKLSDLYDRAGIMPSLSTTLMSTSDIAKGRDRTKPYMGVLMDDIMAPSTRIKPASSSDPMDYFLDLDEVIKHASVLLSDIPIVT